MSRSTKMSILTSQIVEILKKDTENTVEKRSGAFIRYSSVRFEPL